MNIKLDLPKIMDLRPRLTVVGVGGAGGNAVNNMIGSGLSGVSFVVANTDAQSLANSSADSRLQLGSALTEGLGAGARPEIGQAAAEEALEDIRAKLSGSHMVFIAAGMGGGTGTGAAAVIARVARECGALTVAVVTKPFQFEGSRRMRAAEQGIAALKPNVDTMIVIPNQNLFRIANAKTTFADAFVLADQVLYSGIACIVDLIVKEGLINLDFADVRTVMSGMGAAMMGTGEAAGENRAVAAAEEAISNPLLDDISLRGARGLLLSITGGHDMTLYEVDEAASRVREEVDADANIIVGATFDDTLGDRIRVSIVASGMERAGEDRQSPPAPLPRAIPPSTYLNPTVDQFAASTLEAEPSAQSGATGVPDWPREPAAPPAVRNRDDLTRALAEAFGAGQSTPQQSTPQQSTPQPTAPPSPVHPSLGEQRHQWVSPSGAVFEEAAPQLVGASAQPAAAQPSYDQPPASDDPFVAQAPVEVRRAPRRLPEVEDFPPIGQREYRAKAESYADHPHAPPQPTLKAAVSTQTGSRPLTKPPAEPPRKLGFFERLTGAKRRNAERAAPTPSEARDSAQAGGDGSAHRRREQHVENNDFYGKDRNSR